MKKRIIIDADSLLYRSAHIHSDKIDTAQAEAEALEVDDGNDDIALPEAPIQDKFIAMSLTFHSMVKEIVAEVKADAEAKGYEVEDEPVIVLTVKGKHEVCKGLADNFRYKIMANVEDENVKGYKQNRSGMAVPDGLNDLYEYVFMLANSICESGIEADDYCVYYGRKGDIVCALDKDVIGSLEYAYNYGKKEWIENYPEEVRLFPYLQTITGDSSDGLRGVFRVGLKGAEEALCEIDTPYEAWVAVVKQYFLKEQTLEEAVATMRCVRMDMWSEEHGLVMWTPPTKKTTWAEDMGRQNEE